jgi:hypothetical protein
MLADNFSGTMQQILTAFIVELKGLYGVPGLPSLCMGNYLLARSTNMILGATLRLTAEKWHIEHAQVELLEI